MPRLFSLAALLLPLLVPCAAPAGWQPDQAVSGYKNRWALVVGIDYKDAPGDHQLTGAEKDATAVRDLLSQHYGYDNDHIVLLTGKKASAEAIRDRLADGLLGASAVGKDDSVLFFFAGHGNLRAGADGKAADEGDGEVLPDDVQFEPDNKTPKLAKVLRLNEDVVRLLQKSPARHKLLILDCCHAGAVFQLNGHAAGKFEDAPSDEDLFRTPAFQAITACRAKQYAQDQALEGHSPFTYALLKALRTIPLQQRADKAFTANHLFAALKYYFQDLSSNKQSPQCKWLDGPLGEFHFFPSGEFKEEEFENESTRRMLVAMVPGAFGNWWFDETPWLMPSLRLQILNGLGSFRSTGADEISKEQLKKAARDILQNADAGKDPLTARRLGHLKRLLGLEEKGKDPKKILKEIADDLKEMTAKAGSKADPTDLHYLAVLMHGLGEVEGAEDAYRGALDRYQELVVTQPSLRPLQALCLTDRAWYELNVSSKYEDAARDFAEAHRLVEAGPPPFLIFTLCWESDAWLRLGRWGQAQKKLLEAREIADRVDRDGADPLTAAVHTRMGWSYMERWLIRDAAEEFKHSNQVLEKLRKEKEQDGGQLDLNALILAFHNAHGLAMTSRFLGDQEGALGQYRELVQVIRRRSLSLQDETGQAVDYLETRGRLIERLVNSMERQADCNLFGDRPDLAEAADDYRRALRVCPYLSPDREAAASLGLLYKQAIALALPSPVRDVDAARDLIHLAGEKAREFGFKDPATCDGAPLGDSPRDATLKDLSDRLRFLAVLADALVGYSCDGNKTKGLQRLRAMIANRSTALGANIPRDDLESLLFATKVLVQQQSPPPVAAGLISDAEGVKHDGADTAGASERFQRMRDVEQLLMFCRRALRGRRQTSDGEAGACDATVYLRQYYDAAIQAMLESNPKSVKAMVEAAYEATEGKPYVKPAEPSPLLVLYAIGGRCHLFLDVPHGVSSHYVTDDADTIEQVRVASRTKEVLDLPASLHKDLMHVQAPILVRWKDSFVGLGSPVSGYYDPQAMPSADGRPAVPNDPKKCEECVFPFSLRGIKILAEPAGAPGKATAAK